MQISEIRSRVDIATMQLSFLAGGRERRRRNKATRGGPGGGGAVQLGMLSLRERLSNKKKTLALERKLHFNGSNDVCNAHFNTYHISYFTYL